MAQRVMRAVAAALPGGHLCRDHIWLVSPPAGVQQRVWDIVCLSAIYAAEFGRRRMYDPPVSPALSPVDRAAAKAEAAFWGCLTSFAALRPLPRGWASVPLNHPFLSCVGGTTLTVVRGTRL